MTLPPYEWPTRITGLLTRPIVAFTKATSSAVVLRPYCAAIHSYPSACRGTISLLKHEPSAQSPWQNTMPGFESLDIAHLSDKRVLLDLRYLPGWHGMPARTHTSRAATNASCASGGTDRSLPGAHAQRTSGSTFMCSMTSSPVRWPPFRAGSFICSQICALVRPSHFMDNGARCQVATPGTKPSALLVA